MSVVHQAGTFFGAPLCLNPDEITADVALVGVPMHPQGSLLDSERATGPQAVRDARVYYYAGRPGNQPAVGYYDYDTDTDYLKGVSMVDCGDLPIIPGEVEGNAARIESTVRRILDRGAFPVVVGGNHAIAAYSCKAFDKYQPLDVVHFDAHHDYYYGPNYGWTGALRRIDRVCGEAVRNLSTIGLRPRSAPHTSRDIYDDMKKRGVQIVTAKRFREIGPKEAISVVPEEDRYIYVTLDIDVLDTPYVPEIGPLSVGGLTYLQMAEALRELSKKGKIVGLDLASISASRGTTGLVAGQLILDLLSMLFPSKR